jgi:hypothetical protein
MHRSMSTQTVLSLFATGCLGLATWQSGNASDADARLATLAKDCATLQKDLAETRTLVEKTARYAAEQARAASAMAEVLDASEKAGFTFGINPESRIVLLQGWRDALAAAQRDVPVVPAAPPAPATAKSATTR